jgi:hypothetical protein
MSPYRVTLADIVDRFATSPLRIEILTGLLRYRQALREVGISAGFQWIDGSFVEDVEARRGRPPADIDVVTFVAEAQSDIANALVRGKHVLADRTHIKTRFKCDAFFVTLGSKATSLVSLTRYWFGLFSHQRDSKIWKGILEAPLDTLDDDRDARLALASKVTP